MKQTYVGLQVLRFAAAMLVAVMHITQAISIHLTGRGEGVYWGTGAVGVDIFFVISGFVMAISTAGWAGPSEAWVFARRRIQRIVPLYWVYTLLKAALIAAVPALAVKSSVVPLHLAASLAFVPMTAPWGLVQPVLPVGWTLNFEMLFYAVFGLAIAARLPRIATCLAGFALLFIAAQFLPGVTALHFYAQSIIFEFIVGVAFAQALLRWGPGPVLAGALLLLAGTLFTFGLGWDPDSDRFFPWGVGAAAIVLGTLWLEPVIVRMPLARPLAFLGDASYSIYLSHTFVVPAVVMVLKRLHLGQPLLAFVLASAAVMLAGAASYLWLEKPLIAGARRLLFKPRAPRFPHAANPASK
ncbi:MULTISPECIES: acyltransferase [Ramlibacter]|uniref:Acyltransferase n=1 Tax=Ramlibacter aquaticus TaxID=2780094 RepID=A0ABR9SH76_9BURK|nr:MULTISPECIES: acyltransferase [Ramlibacter]MBE7941709.1 acyltransferase [Ramlibacter aquaticus]